MLLSARVACHTNVLRKNSYTCRLSLVEAASCIRISGRSDGVKDGVVLRVDGFKNRAGVYEGIICGERSSEAKEFL